MITNANKTRNDAFLLMLPLLELHDVKRMPVIHAYFSGQQAVYGYGACITHSVQPILPRSSRVTLASL